MEYRQGNGKVVMLLFLVLALTLADENHPDGSILESDDTTPDLTTTNTILTLTERPDFSEYDQTTNPLPPINYSTEEVTTDDCQLPADPGPCMAELIKFFYDVSTKRCRQFIYGGCDGNRNNFVTESECQQACSHIHDDDSLDQSDSFRSEFPFSSDVDDQRLRLVNGHGETSFTFSAEYPFIQLKAVDISDFKLR